MQLLEPALSSSNPYERKASLIALAVLAEGCADYIRNRQVMYQWGNFVLCTKIELSGKKTKKMSLTVPT